MPIYTSGDLWSELGRANLILVTTNSFITKSGDLVMGRGAALEAKQRYRELPQALGQAIQTVAVNGIYGILIGIQSMRTSIGAFQVKYHWKDEAKLELIAYSAGMLFGLSQEYDRIALNFPGIGNGRLHPTVVRPFLNTLPSNVIIYTKD